MNIQIPYTWLLEHLDTRATPKQIAKYLSLCGPSVERILTIEGEPVFDIEVTTNRVDCMSVVGIAREAAAILPQFKIPARFKAPSPPPVKQILNPIPLYIKNDPKLCKRIMAIVMEIEPAISSTLIQKRLKQVGMRPLNSIVDVTNYIMNDVGHPTHVFDYDKIKSKKLIIRKSKKGETAVSFDNKKYTLTGGDIVIDDGTGTIIDLPGIIGTKNSVVSPQTKRIIFFMETSNHIKIRQTSMTHGIRTVAATLNEKSVDPELAPLAFAKGVNMFKQMGGKQISSLIDIYPGKKAAKTLMVTHALLEKLMGVKLALKKVMAIFSALGFEPMQNQGEYRVKIPSWRRKDINIKEDLVEEIARIYGYHNIPSAVPAASFMLGTFDKKFYWEQKLKDAFKYSAFTELYTYSLVSEKLIVKTGLEPKTHLKLKNPLSEEWEYLRTQLLPSVLTTYSENESRGQNLSLFEIANVYLPKKKDLPEEKLHLALVSNKDLLSLRDQLQEIFASIGQKLVFTPRQNKYISRGFIIRFKDKEIGYLGCPVPYQQKIFSLARKIVVAELKLENIISTAKISCHYEQIAKFSPIIEDLTFEVPPTVSRVNISREITSSGNPLVEKVEWKYDYQNRATFTIYYLDKNKQLTSLDVAENRKNIVTALQTKLNCRLVGSLG